MINSVVLTGRLTKDIELRRTGDGTPYTFFTLAVNSGKDEADFIPCTAWRQTAELLNQYVGQGSLIGVQGQIKVYSQQVNGEFETRTNINVAHITFLESRKMQAEGGAAPQNNNGQGSFNQQPQGNFGGQQTVNAQDINLEEIKF